MIQQTLLQNYAYTKKRSLSLDKLATERDLVNGAKADTSRQNIHNS